MFPKHSPLVTLSHIHKYRLILFPSFLHAVAVCFRLSTYTIPTPTYELFLCTMVSLSEGFRIEGMCLFMFALVVYGIGTQAYKKINLSRARLRGILEKRGMRFLERRAYECIYIHSPSTNHVCIHDRMHARPLYCRT